MLGLYRELIASLRAGGSTSAWTETFELGREQRRRGGGARPRRGLSRLPSRDPRRAPPRRQGGLVLGRRCASIPSSPPRSRARTPSRSPGTYEARWRGARISRSRSRRCVRRAGHVAGELARVHGSRPFVDRGALLGVPGDVQPELAVGRLPNAMANLCDAAAVCVGRAAASGYLITDWGQRSPPASPSGELRPARVRRRGRLGPRGEPRS